MDDWVAQAKSYEAMKPRYLCTVDLFEGVGLLFFSSLFSLFLLFSFVSFNLRWDDNGVWDLASGEIFFLAKKKSDISSYSFFFCLIFFILGPEPLFSQRGIWFVVQ